MKVRWVLAAFVGGLVVGGLVVGLWPEAGEPKSKVGRPKAAEPIPEIVEAPTKFDPAEARELMARVADNFTGVDQHSLGRVFYGPPKPYNNYLCRVDRFTIADKVVRGFGTNRERFEDDLDIETLYGIWLEPGRAPPRGENRDTACAAYRDFDRLFFADKPISAEDTIVSLTQARTAARSGALPYPVTCQDQRSEPAADCDGVALLRTLDLTKIHAIQDQEPEDGFEWQERIALDSEPAKCSGRSCGQLCEIEVLTFRPSGDGRAAQRVVRKIDVVWEAYC